MNRSSYLTVTDQFCGAGGSSLGALAAGLEIRLALNHWQLAIDTHAANFPEVDHVCEDVSAVDPRRYAATDISSPAPSAPTIHWRRERAGKTSGNVISSMTDPRTPRSSARGPLCGMWCGSLSCTVIGSS